MTARSQQKESLRLLIVDDHAMFRQALANILEKEGFQIVGEFGSSADAIAALPRGRADVVLLGVNLGPERGLDFVTKSRPLEFEGKILAVTAGISGQEAVQLLEAGVAGIVHKNRSIQELCQVI